MGGGDINIYLYAGGNPVNFVDPMGLKSIGLPGVGPFGFPIPPVAIPGTPEHEAYVESVENLIGKIKWPEGVEEPINLDETIPMMEQPLDPNQFQCEEPPEICQIAMLKCFTSAGKWYEKSWACPVAFMCISFGGPPDGGAITGYLGK